MVKSFGGIYPSADAAVFMLYHVYSLQEMSQAASLANLPLRYKQDVMGEAVPSTSS